MASGTISLGTSSNGKLEARIRWSSSSNGTVKNTSTVTGTLEVRRTDAYTTTGTWTGELDLGAAYKTYSEYAGITSKWVTLCSFSTTQKHADDGKGTCTIYGFLKCPSGTSLAGETLSATKTVTLDTIPRFASITDAPDTFNDEAAELKITYSNPAGNSVDELAACISLTGAKADIAYRAISKTGTTYTFKLTEAERNVLRNATTGSNSRTVRFYIRTIIDDVTKHDYLSSTFTIINGKPTLSPSVIDVGNTSKNLTGDPENKIIRYFNSMQVSSGAAAIKGAKIKSQSIVCGSKKLTSGSGILGYVESASFKFTVTDDRGNTTTQTVTKTLIPYVKPTCNMVMSKPSVGGPLQFTLKGDFYNGSFGAVDNELTLQYRYKVDAGEYGEWIDVVPTHTGTTYEALVEPINVDNLNYKSTYTFQARIKDTIGIYDVTTPERVVKTTPIFDWGKDDFRVNGDFSVTGGITPRVLPEGADLNEYLDPNSYVSINGAIATYINCPIDSGTFKMEVSAGGDVGQRQQTLTYISKTDFKVYQRHYYGGDWVKDSDGNYIWNCVYSARGNLLWSGGYYMTSGQTANLSQPVSKQPHGIVLVFSTYSDGASADTGFNSFFVPKQLVEMHPGCGHSFFMGGWGNMQVFAHKYVYINENSIAGNDANKGTQTGSITLDNSQFVLRYVIGV